LILKKLYKKNQSLIEKVLNKTTKAIVEHCWMGIDGDGAKQLTCIGNLKVWKLFLQVRI